MGKRSNVPKSAQLTAVVLCKDAGETLRQCLISLEFCDRVIVADDGSSDESTEIAKYYGVKLVHLAPIDSFAQKRNQTLAHIKTGWVVFVDADEQVSPLLAKAIERTLKDPQADGYFIERQDHFMGKPLNYGEGGSMWLLRLARLEAGKWHRQVHEFWAVSGELDRIQGGKLLHFPHPSLESFLDSLNHYTQLEISERGKDKIFVPLVWLQLFLYPPGKLVYNYVFKLGFLDGIPGLVHAYMMSLHSLLVRIKILEYVRSRTTS